ncbi:hypothetical protein JKF63_04349 [Porcisia hertigi]|uniref:Uncharacterized protein n=1 Tax=Porcisia hertigi TaxID=2761500 RepID=A0A836INM2_9TRYP|nr:hypothetical protein JKF63_04349 [Porcisia hertigi]
MTDAIADTASRVKMKVNTTARDGQSAIHDAAASVQQQAQTAINTMQAYVHEGQRIVSEKKARSQDAAKKAVNTAHEYVEDARKKADFYMGNVRTSAQSVVDNAKEQVTAVRSLVTEKTQPYVSNYQDFDVTKTAAFHVCTHLISLILYVVWRVTLVIPTARTMITVVLQKEADAQVASNCAVMIQKVPVVGRRTAELVTIAVNSIRTDLKEQIAQYNAATPHPKTA